MTNLQAAPKSLRLKFEPFPDVALAIRFESDLALLLILRRAAGRQPSVCLAERQKVEPEALADFLLSIRLAPRAQPVLLIQPVALFVLCSE